jgi:hypothetical protein
MRDDERDAGVLLGRTSVPGVIRRREVVTVLDAIAIPIVGNEQAAPRRGRRQGELNNPLDGIRWHRVALAPGLRGLCQPLYPLRTKSRANLRIVRTPQVKPKGDLLSRQSAVTQQHDASAPNEPRGLGRPSDVVTGGARWQAGEEFLSLSSGEPNLDDLSHAAANGRRQASYRLTETRESMSPVPQSPLATRSR